MVIAKIKLAPGNAGWYDQATGIHLTIANPIAEIKAGMNLEHIRTGLRFKTIELLSGSVKEEDVIEAVEAAMNPVAKAQKEEILQEEVVQEAEPQVEVEKKEVKKTSGRKKKEEKK